jgi:hypothetical protein
MKIKLTSVHVDDQEKALRFYTEVLGFAKKADFSQGPFRWLTVASPEEQDHPFALDCLQKAQQAGLTGSPAVNPFKKEGRVAKGTKGITRAEMGTLLNPNGKNCRDVWAITPVRDSSEHSDVMPFQLAELCIKAGIRPGDIVLDPSAATALPALRHLTLAASLWASNCTGGSPKAAGRGWRRWPMPGRPRRRQKALHRWLLLRHKLLCPGLLASRTEREGSRLRRRGRGRITSSALCLGGIGLSLGD